MLGVTWGACVQFDSCDMSHGLNVDSLHDLAWKFMSDGLSQGAEVDDFDSSACEMGACGQLSLTWQAHGVNVWIT